MTGLADMPIERRDELIAQVMAFLTERGYRIIAPGRELCGHLGCGTATCCAHCASVRPPAPANPGGGA